MKMFNNRKGIELSINFIVMLILAIAVFAGGLMFASKFFGHAENVRASLDSQTERQIEKLLDSGSPVVLPVNTKEIFRKKHDTFGVGVMAGIEGDYTVHAEFVKGVDKNKGTINDPLEVSGDESTQHLMKNEKGKFMLLVSVPKGATSGTYIYKVWVSLSGSTDANLNTDEYDAPLQMMIKVP